MKQPGPELQPLAVFLGTWNIEGPTYDADGSSTPMHHLDTFEWLPGGFFLVHRWTGAAGSMPFEGMEVVGLDGAGPGFVSRFFDNQGNSEVYRVTERDGTWTYVGEKQRATFAFDADGQGMKIHWDQSSDGKTWTALCDWRAVRKWKDVREGLES